MNDPKQTAAIEAIAKNVMGLETLETRMSDSLDFHEIAVWTIEEALILAYNAGQAAARRPSKCQKLG